MGNKIESKEPKSNDYKIIIEPRFTEKTTTLGTEVNRAIAFVVDRKASKDEIKSAVERIFKVEVAEIRTMNYLGKPKKSGRSSGRRASWKKAYISLKPGFSIDLVEGI